jgi:hypothetical protein
MTPHVPHVVSTGNSICPISGSQNPTSKGPPRATDPDPIPGIPVNVIVPPSGKAITTFSAANPPRFSAPSAVGNST